MRMGAMNWTAFFEAHPDTPGKLAAFAYAFEWLEIAGYEQLSRVATRAGDTETVQLAQRISAEERAAAEKLRGLLPEAARLSLMVRPLTDNANPLPGGARSNAPVDHTAVLDLMGDLDFFAAETAAVYACPVELLEREEALATLIDAHDAAARGMGRVVFVTGEPGIGKTSLVTRFVENLGPATRVLTGTCDDLSIPRPLGPLRDLAGSVSPALAEAIANGAPAARGADAARRGARAAAAPDRARARGRPLGRRRDVRLDHRARPPHRRPAGAARADLPRRRGAARAPAPRRARRDPRRPLRSSSSWRRSPRARWPGSPAPTRRRCTPRAAATRSTSTSSSARAPRARCRRR